MEFCNFWVVVIGSTVSMAAQPGHTTLIAVRVIHIYQAPLQPLLRLALYRSQFLSVEARIPTPQPVQLVVLKFWL